MADPTTGPATENRIVYNITEIMKFLPHRYPFLLVDRIVELDPPQRIVGLKNVTMNEEFFQGHFPGAPVMPGVLILEAMAQVAGVMLYREMPDEDKAKKLIYFTGIENAKFRRPVVPGDQLRMEIELVYRRNQLRQSVRRARWWRASWRRKPWSCSRSPIAQVNHTHERSSHGNYSSPSAGRRKRDGRPLLADRRKRRTRRRHGSDVPCGH